MTTLRSIMSPEFLEFAPTMTVREAIDQMRRLHLPSAPVRRAGRVVGVVDSDDLSLLVPRDVEPTDDARTAARDASAPFSAGPPRGLARNDREVPLPMPKLLERVLVEDVMHRRVFSLPPDTDAAAASAMMRRSGDRQVLVTDGDRLLGIVFGDELARVVGRGDRAAGTTAEAAVEEL